MVGGEGSGGGGGFNAGKYRKVDIEGDESTVLEVHSKIEHLINWHSTKARADYLEAVASTRRVKQQR